MGGGGGGRGGGGGLGPRGLTGGGGPNPFTFGSETSRKYNLTFSVSARNLLNIVNYGPPVGILGSSQFGESNSSGRSAVRVGLGGPAHRSADAVLVLSPPIWICPDSRFSRDYGW